MPGINALLLQSPLYEKGVGVEIRKKGQGERRKGGYFSILPLPFDLFPIS